MIRLSRAQLREVDKRSVETYGLPGVVLMENAARAVVDTLSRLGIKAGSRCLILCGRGNNGGDALAVARHLSNRGVALEIVRTFGPDTLTGDAAIQWRVIEQMTRDPHGPVVHTADKLESLLATGRFDRAIDGLFGTGLTSEVREPAASVIEKLNCSGIPVLAIDLPSGMDCDTGRPLGVCVRADCTVSFVAEKIGFAHPEARQYTGEIVVGDIGCPRELINQIYRELPTA